MVNGKSKKQPTTRHNPLTLAAENIPAHEVAKQKKAAAATSRARGCKDTNNAEVTDQNTSPKRDMTSNRRSSRLTNAGDDVATNDDRSATTEDNGSEEPVPSKGKGSSAATAHGKKEAVAKTKGPRPGTNAPAGGHRQDESGGNGTAKKARRGKHIHAASPADDMESGELTGIIDHRSKAMAAMASGTCGRGNVVMPSTSPEADGNVQPDTLVANEIDELRRQLQAEKGEYPTTLWQGCAPYKISR